MKKIALLLLINFFGLLLLAQSNLDSLYNVWDNKTLSDTSRLRAISMYIEEGYSETRPDSAIHFAKLQYDYAKKTNHLDWQAKALLAEADAYLKMGDVIQAQKVITASVEIHEELNDEQGLARSLIIKSKIYNIEGNAEKAIQHIQKSIQIYKKLKNEEGLALCYVILGNAHTLQFNYNEALNYLNKGRKLYEKLQNQFGLSSAINTIGLIYFAQKEYQLALDCYTTVLKEGEKSNNSMMIGGSMANIGSVYAEMNENEKAIEFYNKGLEIAKKMQYKNGVGGLLIDITIIYIKLGDYQKAMENAQKSLKIAEEIGATGLLANAQFEMARIYREQNNTASAKKYAQKSLNLAKQIADPTLIKQASELLFLIFEEEGNYKKSLEMHLLTELMKDSINTEKNQKAIIQQEFVFAYEKKSLADSLKAQEARLKLEIEHQKEVYTQKQTRNILMGVGLLLLISAIGLFARVRFVKKSKRLIEIEKERSEELLLNILPYEVAEELKAKGSADAQLIDFSTVLFTDFKGFTALSEILSPEKLVSEINVCFSAFDHITAKYNIEKIKTIGDAYMAAGGLPTITDTHALDVVNAALEIKNYMLQYAEEKKAKGEPYFEIRIGVHTGPVVAGIVGVKKFQYDIWGDTVNTASRMESSGEVGQVNISQTTYELVKDNPSFSFESRGKIAAKGKGEMEMYFVDKKTD